MHQLGVFESCQLPASQLPDPFLVSRFAQTSPLDPVTLCAGFDGGNFRCVQLAKHLTEWVVEFSLRSSEREIISPGKIVAVVREAASRVYKTDSVNRGEAGELLLHVACRQEFETQQLVARLYYKSALDQQVHGFDCVHFRMGAGGKVELWLGESKLYSSKDDAITKARASIKEHLDRGFIESQKMLILPKLADESRALAATVQHLFHKNTPVDEFLEAMVIPVLIACDSDGVAKSTSVTTEYIDAVKGEMVGVSTKVKKGTPFASLRIQPVYVPLRSKEDLRKAFGEALKGLQ
jgi:hypothetical protein